MRNAKLLPLAAATVILSVFGYSYRDEIKFSLWRFQIVDVSDCDVLAYAERTGSLTGKDLGWLRERLSGNIRVIKRTDAGYLAEWTRTRDAEKEDVYGYGGTAFVIVTPTGTETISEVRYIKGF